MATINQRLSQVSSQILGWTEFAQAVAADISAIEFAPGSGGGGLVALGFTQDERDTIVNSLNDINAYAGMYKGGALPDGMTLPRTFDFFLQSFRPVGG